MTTFLKLIKNPLGLIGLVLLVFFQQHLQHKQSFQVYLSKVYQFLEHRKYIQLQNFRLRQEEVLVDQ